jgi:tRNA(Arg) A34 adenosine deaminase TadA
MCFGALYWARPDVIYYANTQQDAAAIGFDDAFIYEQLAIDDYTTRKIPLIQIPSEAALQVFRHWKSLPDKGLY